MDIVAPAEIRTPFDLAFLAGAPGDGEDLTVDLRHVQWIAPIGVVAVLATCLRAGSASVALPVAEPVRSYLTQIGFPDELARHGWLDASPEGILHDVSNGVPVTRLDRISEVEELFDALSVRLADTVPYPVRDRLSVVLYELSQNAREHGSRCFLVVQTPSDLVNEAPGVQAAVGDFGPGFAATLAFLRPTDDAHAILRAFEVGVSRTGDSVRGIGLDWVRRSIDEHPGASIWLASGAGVVRYAEGLFHRWLTDSVLVGTFVSVHFPYAPMP